ncbi:MAG: WD40/YVTN/BNR-like repeat-containing protein [Acidobacteriota bacterium]
MKTLRLSLILLFFFALWSGMINASFNEEKGVTPSHFKNLLWRSIGPANMVGRVSDVEGVPGDPNIVYVGTASGGVWKTNNGGTTWKPIFDEQPVASIGDIALEPGNPDVVYVGTGESNVRNSVSFGNGVYKSTDGGNSWSCLGLKDTEHISRIVINPHNPNVVYVGAVGRAFGPNPARGVFVSRDGGRNWEKTLYKDERHGISDMDINPKNPNIVFAGVWKFLRRPWTFESGDTEGGVFRSIDGGRTWNKVTNGLPEVVGRIGIKVAPSNPDVVYAVTESPEGTLYRSRDGGKSFYRVSEDVEIVSRGFYYTDLRVDPNDENRVYALSSRLYVSIDGGRTFEQISQSTHVDFHSLWIDPMDPDRIWQGQDGGICVSYDRGENWDYVNNICAAQFYQICADNRKPFYYVGGGLQDNGTWYGPSRNKERLGILKDDWRMISFGDGFHVTWHPDDPDLFISESQGGNIMRTHMKTMEQQNISPQPRRADGAPVSELEYRFNWNTPIIPSPHDRKTLYVGGNVVFKSLDFGSTWEVISPDLTTDDPEKQKTAGGPAWPENTTAEYYCTIISLAESPVQPGVIWAGTDDGQLHVTRNGGNDWENVINNVPDMTSYTPVSHVEPSISSAGMAYVAFDRHMLDDFKPYVYRTSDFGRTWVNVTGNLPDNAYVWVVREDPVRPEIIYAGTEMGFFISFNRGTQWVKLHMKNLPPVAVHDILIHPEENDLILGTHGRGIWIFDDISFLRQVYKELLEQEAHLFTVRPALRHAVKPTRYGTGDREYTGENPPYGALMTYYLKDQMEEAKDLRIDIYDKDKNLIRRLRNIPAEKGFNRMAWDLRKTPPRQRKEEEQKEDFFSRGPQGPQVLPGSYTVRLVKGEQAFREELNIKVDPTVDVSEDEIETQHKYTSDLCDMQSRVNDGLRALDTVLEQLQERRNAIFKQPSRFPEEVMEAIENHIKEIHEIQNILTKPEGAPFWSEGPRLIERLNDLFQSIDSVNKAPTAMQMDYFNELEQEFEEGMGVINNYLGEKAKQINKIFSGNNVPPLLLPQVIKY